MYHRKYDKSFISWGLFIVTLLFLFCIPAFSSEPIDGFRDLKFGMSPQEVQALPNCSTSQECIYELSNKNRYVTLTYGTNGASPESESTNNLQLTTVTIDMGQYTEEWYHQLQMILGKSYRLTHDFTDETMSGFLAKQVEKLQAGYENGQVVLSVIRRQFGNMILKVIYQNPQLATGFIRQRPAPPATTP